MIQALSRAFAAAQRGSSLRAPKPGQDDPDLLLVRILFARLALYPFDQLVGRVLRCSVFLVQVLSRESGLRWGRGLTTVAP
jgi:hypothetical protein